MGDTIKFIERGKYDLIEYHTISNIVNALNALDSTAFAKTIKAAENALLVMA